MKFIFTVLIIFYGFRLLMKFLFPFFIKKMMHNVEQKVRAQQANSNQDTTKVGETVIDKAPNKNNTVTKDGVGEYVDFEEVDE